MTRGDAEITVLLQKRTLKGLLRQRGSPIKMDYRSTIILRNIGKRERPMSKFTYDLKEYAEHIVNTAHKSGYSGINVVEKILRDPGFSTDGSRDRVLWWPRNRRIAKMSKAMHQIGPIPQICLIVQHGRIVKEDGNIFNEGDFVKNSSLSLREFHKYVGDAEKKMRRILKGYDKQLVAI